MTTDSVSDERLGELITSHQLEQHSWLRQDQQAPLDYESQAAAYQCQDTLSGLRELRSYRRYRQSLIDNGEFHDLYAVDAFLAGEQP